MYICSKKNEKKKRKKENDPNIANVTFRFKLQMRFCFDSMNFVNNGKTITRHSKQLDFNTESICLKSYLISITPLIFMLDRSEKC